MLSNESNLIGSLEAVLKNRAEGEARSTSVTTIGQCRETGNELTAAQAPLPGTLKRTDNRTDSSRLKN